jgi:hypothetical protein
MADPYSKFLRQLISEPTKPFALEDMEGFPYAEYQRNLTRYNEMERWYDGEVLQETVESGGKKIERYPVKINPIPDTIEKHTHFLFGEVKLDDRPLVTPRIIPREDSDADRKLARKLEEILIEIWSQSQGRAIQWENGARSQLYAGCVFRIQYDNLDPFVEIPFRIEAVHPKYFVGVPDSGNMWRLREAWIIRAVSLEEATNVHGVYFEEEVDETELWLVEHYSILDYEAHINGVPVKRKLANGDWRGVSGPHPWGFIPLVYIPHIRVNGFYGETFIPLVQGLIREINLRIADYGDAVTVDAHTLLGMRNVNGSPTVENIIPGAKTVNLGTNPNITGQDSEPDLFEITKAKASTSMESLVELLYDFYRRFAKVPKVVDGEDEGSQRSGLTLAIRMIALTAHTDTERIFWSTGLDLLNRMLTRMMFVKKIEGIEKKHLQMRIKQEWSPVLPRDREMLVNEAVSLMSAKLGSPERLLEVLGVDDIPEEKKLILDFLKELSEMEADKAQKAMEQKNVKSASNTPATNPKKEKES